MGKIIGLQGIFVVVAIPPVATRKTGSKAERRRHIQLFFNSYRKVSLPCMPNECNVIYLTMSFCVSVEQTFA